MKISVSPVTRAEKLLWEVFRITTLSLLVMLFVASVYGEEALKDKFFLGAFGWLVIVAPLSLLAFAVVRTMTLSER